MRNERLEIKVGAVDVSILERISESDVMNWLVAKLHSLRVPTDTHAYNLGVDVWFRDYCEKHYDASVSVGLRGGRGFTHPTFASALIEAQLEQLNNPEQRAQKKRDKARSLNKEAEELEKVVATVKAGGVR